MQGRNGLALTKDRCVSLPQLAGQEDAASTLRTIRHTAELINGLPVHTAHYYGVRESHGRGLWVAACMTMTLRLARRQCPPGHHAMQRQRADGQRHRRHVEHAADRRAVLVSTGGRGTRYRSWARGCRDSHGASRTRTCKSPARSTRSPSACSTTSPSAACTQRRRTSSSATARCDFISQNIISAHTRPLASRDGGESSQLD